MGEFWQKEAEAKKVGGPEDVTNVNAYTDQRWGELGNEQNFWKQMLTGGGYGLDQMFGPGGYWNSLYGLTMDPTSQLTRGLQSRAQGLIREGTESIGSQFAGLDSLYSGATRDIASQRAMQTEQDVMNSALQAQMGLLGGLGQQTMGVLGQREGIAANSMGAAGAQRSQLAEPWLYQQQYYIEPSSPGFGQGLMELIPSIIGAIVGGGAGAQIGNGVGTGITNAFGGGPSGQALAFTGQTSPPAGGYGWTPYGLNR